MPKYEVIMKCTETVTVEAVDEEAAEQAAYGRLEETLYELRVEADEFEVVEIIEETE